MTSTVTPCAGVVSLDEVRAGRTLEDAFVAVVGGRVSTGSELSWL